jgi:hypothetical protein
MRKKDALLGIIIIIIFTWLIFFLISNYAPPKPVFNASFCIKGICDPFAEAF